MAALKKNSKPAVLKGEQTEVVKVVPVTPSEGVYNGHPVLELSRTQGKFYTSMQFGVGKAKLLLDAMDHIRSFVEKHDKSKPVETPKKKPGRPKKSNVA